jgi:hypothetical protein
MSRLPRRLPILEASRTIREGATKGGGAEQSRAAGGGLPALIRLSHPQRDTIRLRGHQAAHGCRRSLQPTCLGAIEAVEDLLIRRDSLNAEQVWPHLVFRAPF